MGLCGISLKRLSILSVVAVLCTCDTPLEPPYSQYAEEYEVWELLATTNFGEFVRIDIDAGTAELLGPARTVPDGSAPGWTGISFDPSGDLFASSNQFSEIPEPGCEDTLFRSCAHLYKVNPTDGASEIGTTGLAFVSDIDFFGATLLANYFDNDTNDNPPEPLGGMLATIDPVSGLATPVVPDTPFGHADLDRNLLNGGMSVDPVTCDVWVVEKSNRESGQHHRIFRVDPNTGRALSPTVPLGLNGVPSGFGMDALEILPDGRFVGTQARASSNLYLIDPEPDPITGFANLTLISISPSDFGGALNGLASGPQESACDVDHHHHHHHHPDDDDDVEEPQLHTEMLEDINIPLARGTGIVAAGVGLFVQPGTIEINVPGDVQQVLIYWEGFNFQSFSPGDGESLTVAGNLVQGTLIGGPTSFHFNGGWASAYRADITDLGVVGSGNNSIEVAGLGFTAYNNGAGILVIYDDGSGLSEIAVKDGQDLAFFDFPPPEDATVPVTFDFTSAPSARTTDLFLFVGSVGHNRPNVVEVTMGANVERFVDPLHGLDGKEWDTATLPITIPGGVSSMTVQVLSERDPSSTVGDTPPPSEYSDQPASLAWVVAALGAHPDDD